MPIIYLIILILLPISCFATDKVNPTSDLTYSGAFLPPTGTRNSTNYGYTTNGLGWDYNLEKLITVGASNDHPTKSEVLTLPTLVTSETFDTADLNTATVTISFTDITGARQTNGLTGNDMGDILYLPQQTDQDAAKYYWNLYHFYDVGSDYYGMLGWSDTDYSDPYGLWRIDSVKSGNWAQSLCEINNTWADSHIDGKYIGMSMIRESHSHGPSLYAVAPWEDNSGSPPASEALMSYEELMYYGTNNVMESWSYGNSVRGMEAAWVTVGTKQAFVVLWNGSYQTNKGTKWWKGTVANTTVSYKIHCYNVVGADHKLTAGIDASVTTIPCANASDFTTSGVAIIEGEYISYTGKTSTTLTGCIRGVMGTSAASHAIDAYVELLQEDHYEYGQDSDGPQALPTFPMLLFYDVDEIDEIAAGTRDAWDIQPYAYYNLDNYFYENSSRNQTAKHQIVAGMAYDPTNNRLIIAEYGGYYPGMEPYPLYHVITLSSESGSLDTISPSPPSDISVNGSGVLTWTASADDKGEDVTYVIFKHYEDVCADGNDEYRPILSSLSNSWTDPLYISGDTYNVIAYDQSMNSSDDFSLTSTGIQITGGTIE